MTIHVLLQNKGNDMLKASYKINSSKENSYSLLKRLISFKNNKILSIGTSLNGCLIVSVSYVRKITTFK